MCLQRILLSRTQNHAHHCTSCSSRETGLDGLPSSLPIPDTVIPWLHRTCMECIENSGFNCQQFEICYVLKRKEKFRLRQSGEKTIPSYKTVMCLKALFSVFLCSLCSPMHHFLYGSDSNLTIGSSFESWWQRREPKDGLHFWDWHLVHVGWGALR